MEELTAVIELKRRPIPEQLKIVADNLEALLKHGYIPSANAHVYVTVLGVATHLIMIANELEEQAKKVELLD